MHMGQIILSHMHGNHSQQCCAQCCGIVPDLSIDIQSVSNPNPMIFDAEQTVNTLREEAEDIFKRMKKNIL